MFSVSEMLKLQASLSRSLFYQGAYGAVGICAECGLEVSKACPRNTCHLIISIKLSKYMSKTCTYCSALMEPSQMQVSYHVMCITAPHT